jgi:cell division protein FtsZ
MTLFEVNEASTLVQEAAHEDANIIFGAVIDETMQEDEVRVTVIATGLEGVEGRTRPPRTRRTYEEAAPATMQAQDNVTSLRPEPEIAQPVAQGQHRSAAQTAEIDLEPLPVSADEMADATASAGEFTSPFEDELDTPAFLRRRQSADEDDKEEPTFLRRAQD